MTDYPIKIYEGFKKFNITGRGIVFAGKVPLKYKLPTIGEVVMINGLYWMIRSIEMSIGNYGKRKEGVGFLCRELPREKQMLR